MNAPKIVKKVPSTQDIAKLVKEVQSIGERLAAYATDLTVEERQRALKFRHGGDNIVRLVGELASAQALALPGISVEGMGADLDLAQRLQPLAAALQVLSQTLADTVLQAQSDCWWAATAFYTTLLRLANADPKLQAALRPVVTFFAHGPRKTVPPQLAAAVAIRVGT
jgi:hypothetical protein